MRWSRLIGSCLVAVLAGAACGSSDKKSSTTTSSTASIGTTSTVAPLASSTTVITAPVVTDVFPTLSLPCQAVPTPVTPVTSPAQSASVLLVKVNALGDRCVDHVVFSFTSKSANPPGYVITYGTPPFTQDASGAPVAVKGKAFVVVTMKPAYGFNFDTGQLSYTGPKRITPTHANHVAEIVETGDFEGVMTWVIGLDSKRPFTVEATGKPQTQLAVSIS